MYVDELDLTFLKMAVKNMFDRMEILEKTMLKNKLKTSPLKELYDDYGTTGLPTRGSKLGKRVAGKRKKKGTRTGSHGLRKKPDDSGDSPVAAPKKRGRPPLNRVPSK